MTKTHDLRRRGLEALCRELGPTGMLRFLKQYESGLENHPQSGHNWADELSLVQLRARSEERRRKKRSRKPDPGGPQ